MILSFTDAYLTAHETAYNEAYAYASNTGDRDA